MFMASRIQTRAFSASARNVSNTLPRHPIISHAGIGDQCASMPSSPCSTTPCSLAATRPAPVSDGQRWH